MFQFCFFISMAYSYCIETKPALYYPTIVERSTEVIIRYEWFAPQAYMDTSGRYSIGYGTRSTAGEVITQQEAYARMQSIVRQSAWKVMRDFPEANEDQIVALTSLYYNCDGWYKKLKKHGIAYHKTPGFCQLPGHSGLVKRRAEERALIFWPE